jgi:LysM repeat protein
MMRSEYRKALAIGAVTGFALPLFAAPAAATPPRDWPATAPSAPAPLAQPAASEPARTLVRESRALSGRIYEVRPGDTLWAIAERQLGDPTRWPELFEANRSRLSSPHLIRPNQRLELGSVQLATRSSGGSRAQSQPSGALYTVKSGDTLGKIAQRHYGKASDWPVLYSLNRSTIANPDAIYPGQVIRVRNRKTVVVSPRAKVKHASRTLSRQTDDGRLLKGHRRINGSYYAKGADGQLIWADTQERVHPADSTLKTALAPKIREAFKVPAPKPVAAAKPAPTKPSATEVAKAKPSAPKVMIELPAAQKPAFLSPAPQDRLAAGALSLVVPGAGQLYNGDPLRGALFATAGLAGLGATVYGVANDRQDIGVAASAGLVALSLWSAADAYLNAPAKAVAK